MKPNYNANAFLLVVSIIFATLGHQVGAESDSTPKKLSCGPGTFYSTSVIPEGDCVGCPEPGQCFREATEDDKNNCDQGCGKPTPPPSVIFTKITSEATKTTMIIPTTTSSVTSSAEVNDQTPRTAGRSSDKRWVYIGIGLTVALGVVAFIACVLYLRWRKQKIKKLNHPPIRYTVSSPSLGGVQETGSPQYSSEPNLPITYC